MLQRTQYRAKNVDGRTPAVDRVVAGHRVVDLIRAPAVGDRGCRRTAPVRPIFAVTKPGNAPHLRQRRVRGLVEDASGNGARTANMQRDGRGHTRRDGDAREIGSRRRRRGEIVSAGGDVAEAKRGASDHCPVRDAAVVDTLGDDFGCSGEAVERPIDSTSLGQADHHVATSCSDLIHTAVAATGRCAEAVFTRRNILHRECAVIVGGRARHRVPRAIEEAEQRAPPHRAAGLPAESVTRPVIERPLHADLDPNAGDVALPVAHRDRRIACLPLAW